MVTAKFSFEGGTNGANVAAGAGASTGDTNFDVVTRGSGATVAYDNTHPGRGSLGVKIATGATSVTAHVAWTTTIGTQTTVFIRALVYITGAPSANTRVINMVGSAASRGNILLNASGKFIFTNTAGTTLLTSATLPVNSQFRLEAKWVGDASVGGWEYKIWNDPRDVGTPNDTNSSFTANTTGSADTYRFGVGTNLANAGPYWLDDVGVSTTGYIGPEDPRVTGTAAVNTKKCSIAAQGLGLQASIRATSHYASTATEGSFTMPLPTGWQAGDTVLIGVSLTAANGTISGPSTGWSADISSQHSSSSTSAEHAVFKRKMQAGDSNPVIQGSSGRYSAVAVAIRNADTVTLEDVTPVFDSNSGISYPNLELPSITPTNANDLLLAFAAVRNGTNNATTTFAAPPDMSVYDQATSGVGAVSNSAIALLASNLTSNAATGTKTVTLTSSSGTTVNQMSSVFLIRTETISVSGGPTLKKTTVSGSITATTAISGGPTLKKIRVAGSINETTSVSGGPRLKKIQVSGSVEKISDISGGPTLKKVRVSASVTTVSTISGGPTLKKMRVSAVVTEIATISGGPTLKKVRVFASTTEMTVISGGPTLKRTRVHVNAVRPKASELMVFTPV